MYYKSDHCEKPLCTGRTWNKRWQRLQVNKTHLTSHKSEVKVSTNGQGQWVSSRNVYYNFQGHLSYRLSYTVLNTKKDNRRSSSFQRLHSLPNQSKLAILGKDHRLWLVILVQCQMWPILDLTSCSGLKSPCYDVNNIGEQHLST